MIAIHHLGNRHPGTEGLEIELLFTYRIEFQVPPLLLGSTPDGIRMEFPFLGGEVFGPRINGQILPVGGDWLTVRPDGVGTLDMRMTIETDDGATISVPDLGMLDHGEDGYANALAGQLLPDGTPFQVAPRFHTAHPDYLWLNRLQGAGAGQVFPSFGEARCDVYAIR